MGEESEKIDKKEPKAADVPKKPRGRKKLQYQTLRKQMEFYFSDANLSRDRFVGQLLQESQYVDLNVFLRFNRIKSITSNIKDIAKALQSSELLKLTECGTKVYRVKPVESKSNAEECTIYVENIPTKADHDYLTDIFSGYGPIDYISIPRFKHSQMNKGFAFIEFKNPESVGKAITAFKGFGSHLLDKIEPAQLCSIKTFNEERDLEKAENRRIYNRTDEDENVENEPNDNHETKNKNYETDCSGKNSANVSRKEERQEKKRKNVDLETESCDETKVKKQKVEQFDTATGSSKAKRKISSGADQDTSETELMKHRKEESDVDLPTKKMKKEQSENETDTKKERKRSAGDEAAPENVKIRKERDEVTENDASHEKKSEGEDLATQEELETDGNLAQESSNNEVEVDDFDTDRRKKHRKRKKKSKREKACSGLHILTKKEWKVMRNRYLTEQRKRMSNLKKHLEQNRYYNSAKEDHIEETDETEVNEEENPSNEKCSDVRVTYLPGVIVKILLDEPIVDKESFKNELKRKPEIKYIDVKECLNIVHLRFSSSDAAQQFVQNSPWQGALVLEGSEEQDYWDKVWKDREHKMNKNIRKPKNGRKKLLEKAENMRSMHIRFD